MARLNAAAYVKPSKLAKPGLVAAPLSSKLWNYGGPDFELRECDGDYGEPREKGYRYTKHDLHSCTQAGHIFFHPETRKPPILPAASLRTFVTNNPELPVVVEDDRDVGAAHIVFGRFV